MPKDNQLNTMAHQARSRKSLLLEGAVLFGFWVLMSGKFDFFHLSLGVISVGFVIWMDRKMGPLVAGEENLSFHAHFFRMTLYLPWLFGQMILATMQVARIVLSRQMELSPCLVRFKSEQPHSVARVALGNSITLTPGTLTLEIDGDQYLVHAITESTADGLLAGEMQTRIARLFGSPTGKAVYDSVKINRRNGA
ncbi:MAG: Na+/H+ antiporter subunit E [Opitutales bacterium]